ncbi:transient receptor potential channel [Holotrichia oblita]|uniref:Transient receptor potential channel n=1 Tax=Holotrichia oblita TaxID=644536 RepID=A0ACB9T9J3_HOLOL|nr:transient receptor potential channel [Holotrichia oblita]
METPEIKEVPNLPKALSLEEKKYLLAVERGDMANVRRILEKAQHFNIPNINCVDSLGRNALTLAIDGENLEMVELLVVMGVETKDALLHSINVEFVEAVELLLDHEELIHKDGEPYECKSEYLELRKQCQQFAVDLLHQSRTSEELAVILNHDPDKPSYEVGEQMTLARLELAITYKQKKFVAHPNIQQLLAALWYEGVPGFRRKSSIRKFFIISKVGLLFPFYCLLYMVAPETYLGKIVRKPFMKFLIHAFSYIFFIIILMLDSQRADEQFTEFFLSDDGQKDYGKTKEQRGNPPTILEYIIFFYVIGFICEGIREIYKEGIRAYLMNLWSFIDCTRNILYCLVFALRVIAYTEQKKEIANDPSKAFIPREEWEAFDPQLVAEGLFAAANIFRTILTGLNQLLWYFSDLERKRCYHLSGGDADWKNERDACIKWRGFAKYIST